MPSKPAENVKPTDFLPCAFRAQLEGAVCTKSGEPAVFLTQGQGRSDLMALISASIRKVGP